MAYRIEPFEPLNEAHWPVELQTQLDDGEADGWTLVTLMTRDLPNPQAGQATGLQPWVPYSVLVWYRP